MTSTSSDRAAQQTSAGARRFPTALAAALAFVWAGMVLGVSFLATPVKFMAESLGRPAAFEVGGVTFAAFNRAEIAFALALIVIGWLTRDRLLRIGVLILAVIVALQTVWLLPTLLARVDLILTGQSLPPSTVHGFYSGSEIAKLVLLLAVASLGLKRLDRR